MSCGVLPYFGRGLLVGRVEVIDHSEQGQRAGRAKQQRGNRDDKRGGSSEHVTSFLRKLVPGRFAMRVPCECCAKPSSRSERAYGERGKFRRRGRNPRSTVYPCRMASIR